MTPAIPIGLASAREQTIALVSAGLCLGRVVPPDPAELQARIGPWILATIAERFVLPPPGVVADLGGLLLGMPLRTSLPLPTDDPSLASAVRRYEDAVLGRLAVDRRLAAAGFAVARLPPELHPEAVGILVAGVLGRLGSGGGVEVEPGIVRLLTARSPAETRAMGLARLRDDPVVRARLAEGYAALARAAQRTRLLVGDDDLFALENLVVLRSLTQRLAIVDVLRAEEEITSRLPPRIARRRREAGDVMSRLEDESAYPVGGFASIATAGSLENLVTSELIYMDPPPPPGETAPVDLFDMRYVEGELLYYTRDEAIIVRRRRVVVLALASDLVRARVKDVGVAFQRIVLVLAAVLALTKKLALLLGEEALEIRVVFLSAEPGSPPHLDEELALAELLLREWRELGLVTVGRATWDEVALACALAARRAVVGIVRFHALPVDGVADARITVVDVEAPTLGVEAWTARVVEVLGALL